MALRAKIPVVSTIGFAYRFAFGRLGEIIGVTWPVLVAAAIVNYFVSITLFRTYLAGMGSGDPYLVARNALLQLGWIGVQLLIYASVYVAVVRLALAREGEKVRLGFGMAELRTAMSTAAAALTALFLTIILLTALQGGASLLPLPQDQRQAVEGAGVLLVIWAVIWVGTRLSFFLVPVAVVENRLGLERSWALTGGNFFRILLIGAATLIPLGLAILCVMLALLGPDYLAQIAAAQEAGNTAQVQRQQMAVIVANYPLISGLNLFFAPFLSALLYGLSAAAYRSVAGPPGASLA